MRPAALAFAAAGFGIACLLVLAGGRRLGILDAPAVEATGAAAAAVEAGAPSVADSTAAGESAATKSRLPQIAPARSVAPDIVVPPSIETDGFLREAPRAPLSELSLALPPKPEMPDDWDGTTLFHPVAPASGLIEAKGFRVAVAGVVPVEPEESCTFLGKQWNCGIRARTAFRAFLRGRAVVCAVPPEADRSVIAAKCRVGKQDVGQWLVGNGWARATEAGPYSETGEKARTDSKGIFGPPPVLSD